MKKNLFYHWWLSSEIHISYSSYIMQKQSISFRNNNICFKAYCLSVGDNVKSIALNQNIIGHTSVQVLILREATNFKQYFIEIKNSLKYIVYVMRIAYIVLKIKQHWLIYINDFVDLRSNQTCDGSSPNIFLETFKIMMLLKWVIGMIVMVKFRRETIFPPSSYTEG